MPKTPLTNYITELALPLAASLDVIIWGIEMAGTGKGLVRIFLDTPEGVTISQCTHFSRLLSAALDVADSMTGPYRLEVSSPGLDRRFFTLEQMQAFVGQEIELTLLVPVAACPERRRLSGLLSSVGTSDFVLQLTAEGDAATADSALHAVSVAWDTVRRAKLVYCIPMPEKPGKKKAATPKE